MKVWREEWREGKKDSGIDGWWENERGEEKDTACYGHEEKAKTANYCPRVSRSECSCELEIC